MKQRLFKVTVAGAAFIGAIGAFAFTPRPFNNLVYAIRTSTTSFTYTNTAPTTKSCQNDATNVACTLSTTATAAYFNSHNGGTFPVQSSTPGAPVVQFKDAANIYK